MSGQNSTIVFASHSSQEPDERPRVGQHLRSQRDVRIRFGIMAFRAGRRGGTRSDFYFFTQNGRGPARVHDQNDEVGSLASELKAHAAALQGHHCRRAPWTGEMLAAASGHRSPPVAAAHDEGNLENGRDDNYAFSSVRKLLRDVLRDIQNLIENQAAVLEPISHA